MALIHELQINPEERGLALSRVKFLLQVYRSGHCSTQNLTRILDEWKVIARRIKRGGELIEDNLAALQGQPRDDAHFVALSDLHLLMTKLYSIYDGFFASIHPPDQSDRYERASSQVRAILEVNTSG